MNYAYVRVSTEQQSCSSQKFEITNWTVANGIAIDKWIQEEVSGTVPIDKRKLGAAIRRMKSRQAQMSPTSMAMVRSKMMVSRNVSTRTVMSLLGLRISARNERQPLMP